MSEKIITHEDPTWHNKANFLIFADLSESGRVNGWEQLWARQISSDEFLICCIPFFVYGLALGDSVCTTPKGGRNYVISSVKSRSGRKVFRLWLKDASWEARQEIAGFLIDESLNYEQWPPHLVAVDVPDDSVALATFDRFLINAKADLSILAELGSAGRLEP